MADINITGQAPAIDTLERFIKVMTRVQLKIEQMDDSTSASIQRAKQYESAVSKMVQSNIALAKSYSSVDKFIKSTNKSLTTKSAKLTEVTAKTKELNRAAAKEASRTKAFVGARLDTQAFQQAPLTQQLGYKDAVSGLAKVQKAHRATQKQVLRIWKQMINQGPKAYATRMENDIQRAVGRVIAAENKLKAQTKYTGKAFKKLGQEGKKSIQEMTIGFQGMVRLIGVQLTHQAIAGMIGGLRDGVSAATDLQIKIAEIRTISQNAQLPFEEWRDVVVDLSNEFSKPVEDVAEGVYQTLSNQIAEGAEVTNFLKDSLDFARVTVASTADSVGLLSAAINSFNLEATDAREVAASLFKTIELGRVRAADLANTYGNLAPLAAKLGVRMDELGAAIATVSVRGIRPEKTLTLLRNILLKLVAPTDRMREVLKELGSEIPEEVIKVKGLGAVLVSVAKIMDEEGSPAAKELFGRIRAMTGAMLTAEDGAKRYNAALAEFANANKNYSVAAVDTIQNAGFKLRKEANELRNVFLNDLGQPIIDKISEVNDEIGGLTNVIKSFEVEIKTVAKVTTGATVAMVSYVAIVKAATIAQTAFNIAAKAHPLAILATLSITAAGALTAYLSSLETIDGQQARISKDTEEKLANIHKINIARIEELRKARTKAADEEIKKINKAYLLRKGLLIKEQDLQKELVGKAAKATESAIKKAIDNTKEYIKTLKKDVKELDKLVLESADETRKIDSKDYLKDIRERVIFEIGSEDKINKEKLALYKKFVKAKFTEEERFRGLPGLGDSGTDLKSRPITDIRKKTELELFTLKLNLAKKLQQKYLAEAKEASILGRPEDMREAIDDAIAITKKLEAEGVPLDQIVKEIIRIKNLQKGFEKESSDAQLKVIAEKKKEIENETKREEAIIVKQKEIIELRKKVGEGELKFVDELKKAYESIFKLIKDTKIPDEIKHKIEVTIKESKKLDEITKEIKKARKDNLAETAKVETTKFIEDDSIDALIKNEIELAKRTNEITNSIKAFVENLKKVVSGVRETIIGTIVVLETPDETTFLLKSIQDELEKGSRSDIEWLALQLKVLESSRVSEGQAIDLQVIIGQIEQAIKKINLAREATDSLKTKSPDKKVPSVSETEEIERKIADTISKDGELISKELIEIKTILATTKEAPKDKQLVEKTFEILKKPEVIEGTVEKEKRFIIISDSVSTLTKDERAKLEAEVAKLSAQSKGGFTAPKRVQERQQFQAWEPIDRGAVPAGTRVDSIEINIKMGDKASPREVANEVEKVWNKNGFTNRKTKQTITK